MCCGTGVEGSDIKDVKGEAKGFGWGLDLRDRGHWQVRCFGFTYLTQPHILYGLCQASLGSEHIVDRLPQFHIFWVPALGIYWTDASQV